MARTTTLKLIEDQPLSSKIVITGGLGRGIFENT